MSFSSWYVKGLVEGGKSSKSIYIFPSKSSANRGDQAEPDAMDRIMINALGTRAIAHRIA